MADGLIARLPIGPFASRPRLAGAVAVSVIVWGALVLVPNDLRWSTRAIVGWDAGCAWFIAAAFWLMARARTHDIEKAAAAQDDGRHLILAVVTLAAAASIGAVAQQLTVAKSEHGLMQALRVLSAFVTVAVSWLLVQLIYALHYAHEFYTAADDPRDEDGRRGGLCFPGDDGEADYWDFLHFAVVIGVASQTADVQFTSKRMRRTGTVHSVVAFLFNTVVLALTINLCAGLFGGGS